jgi:hypothetical protein
MTYFFNSTDTMKPLPHKPSVMHTNIEICDIWTLKVFFDTERPVEEYPYEVQIFRNDNNVNDTPFSHRIFLKYISEVDQFVEKFQKWAKQSLDITFNDLKFVNKIAIIARIDPISQDTFKLKIIERPNPCYYDIYFEDGTNPSKILIGYSEKDDVVHYMRWFAQWVCHYHEVPIKQYDEYIKWISDLKRF